MDGIAFTETETKYYNDVFTHLDSEGGGKIPHNHVHEFLRSSKLSHDLLTQIDHLCGGSKQGWYGRREVFLALKFVAAAQRGLPLRTESLALGVDLPLPRLLSNNNTLHDDQESCTMTENCTSSPDLIQLSDSDCNPSHIIDGGYRMMESEDGEGGDEHLSDPGGRMISNSPSVSSPTSDSPTPTNSVHERTWGHSHTHWHGLVNDEHRQLLGTEEDSSDRHSSEDEDYDVWVITEEQRHYYTEQFQSLQPDLHSLVSGKEAKEFFEKSRLPLTELSKIWQLADVSRDGALCLEEFFTAMHLVVLRRNNISLPETLPDALLPSSVKRLSSSSGVEGNSGTSGTSSVMAVAASVGSGSGGTGTVSSTGIVGPAQVVTDVDVPGVVQAKPSSPETLSPTRNKEWTKFVDSPTSTVSSPGLKPVNFDFQKSAVEQDPKILHPKALRLTPDSSKLDVSEADTGAVSAHSSDPVTVNAEASELSLVQLDPSQVASQISNLSPKKSVEPADIKPIQRPLPRKPSGSGVNVLPPPPHLQTGTTDDNGLYGPTSLPMIPLGPLQGTKKEAPPPPPPRPAPRTHTRSSSLDLNKFSRTVFLGAPPAVPPRASPSAISPKKLVYQRSDGDMGGNGGRHSEAQSTSSSAREEAQGSQDCQGEESQQSTSGDPRSQQGMDHAHNSAFQVYRKPPTSDGSSGFEVVGDSRKEQEERARQLALGARPKDKREVQASIRTTKEKNTILTRLNSELNQELTEVMEERIALEMQLEQMKPFSS